MLVVHSLVHVNPLKQLLVIVILNYPVGIILRFILRFDFLVQEDRRAYSHVLLKLVSQVLLAKACTTVLLHVVS